MSATSAALLLALLPAILQVASAASDICMSRNKDTCTLDSQCGFCTWNTEVPGSTCISGGPDGPNPTAYPNQCCDTWTHKDGATGRQRTCTGSSSSSSENCDDSCAREISACKNDQQCLAAYSCIMAKEDAGTKCSGPFCHENCAGAQECFDRCVSSSITSDASKLILMNMGRCFQNCEARKICPSYKTSLTCEADAICNWRTRCNVKSALNVCGGKSILECGRLRGEGCEWDTQSSTPHCFLKTHACFNLTDTKTCGGMSSCVWEEFCVADENNCPFSGSKNPCTYAGCENIDINRPPADCCKYALDYCNNVNPKDPGCQSLEYKTVARSCEGFSSNCEAYTTLDDCEADQSCNWNKHCTLEKNACVDMSLDKCNALSSMGCAWDGARCILKDHPCFAFTVQASCVAKQCDWHEHCNSDSSDGNGNNECPFTSASSPCGFSACQRIDINNPPPDCCKFAIDFCTSTNPSDPGCASEQYALFSTNCKLAEVCSSYPTLDSCEGDGNCFWNASCTLDQNPCIGASQDRCKILMPQGCAWNGTACFLSSHPCFSFDDQSSCEESRCNWHGHCTLDAQSSNNECPFTMDGNPCKDPVCDNIDILSPPTECCKVVINYCTSVHPQDPGCSSEQFKIFSLACDTSVLPCRNFTSTDECQAFPGCAWNTHCTLEDNVCNGANREDCYAFEGEGCAWDGFRCILKNHVCVTFDNREKCEGNGCDWHEHCNPAGADNSGSIGCPFTGEENPCSNDACDHIDPMRPPTACCDVIYEYCTSVRPDDAGCSSDIYHFVKDRCFSATCSALSNSTNCEGDSRCKWDQRCQAIKNPCEGNVEKVCLGLSAFGCKWNNVSLVPHCFLAKTPCNQFGDKKNCESSSECFWQEQCIVEGGNNGCPFTGESNPCTIEACENFDVFNPNRECCDYALEYCSTVNPSDPGCKSDEYLVAAKICMGGVDGVCEQQCSEALALCNNDPQCKKALDCISASDSLCYDEGCTGSAAECEQSKKCFARCTSGTVTNADSLNILRKLLSCQLSCYTDQGCQSYYSQDVCEMNDDCVWKKNCSPIENKCNGLDERGCILAANIGCAWDSQNETPSCYLAKHECFNFQDALSCQAAKCQWSEFCRGNEGGCPFKINSDSNPCNNTECKEVDSNNVPRACCDVAVKHCKLYPNDPGCSSDTYLQAIEKCYGAGVYGKCELEVCADLVKKCNSIPDCAASFKCVLRSYVVSGDCDADCMKQCQASLSTKAGSEVFDLVIKCEIPCHDQETCLALGDSLTCKDNARCNWLEQCVPSTKVCESLNFDSCARASTSGCRWDKTRSRCYLDVTGNPCFTYTTQRQCSAMRNCTWSASCQQGSSASTSTSSPCASCINSTSACINDATCKAAYSCVTSGTADLATNLLTCSQKVVRGTASFDLFWRMANCLLKCNGECSPDTVPSIAGVKPVCGMKAETIAITGNFSNYGANTRALCMFWSTATMTKDGLRPPLSSTWSCNWHGCYSPATIVDGNIFCENPNFLNSDPSLEIRITVKVWNINAKAPQLNFCFSHEGQSAVSWSSNDYATLKLRCPVECTRETVPVLRSLSAPCASPASNVSVYGSFANYGAQSRATCSWYIPSNGTWSCAWHGCTGEATYISAQEVQCVIPPGVPGYSRVVVRVFHAAASNPNSNLCFSNKNSLAFDSGDYLEYWMRCGPNAQCFGLGDKCSSNSNCETTSRCAPSFDSCKQLDSIQCRASSMCRWEGDGGRCVLAESSCYTLTSLLRCANQRGCAWVKECTPVNAPPGFYSNGVCDVECRAELSACYASASCRAALALYQRASTAGYCDFNCGLKLANNDQLFIAYLLCFTKCRSANYGDALDRTCQLPAQPGSCKGSFPRFFYNMTSGKCEQFIYGGCNGNSNNFDSLSSCENRCDKGACCIRTQRRSSGVYGYNAQGYDRNGFDANGVRYDGTPRRYAQLTDSAGFGATGRNPAGYDAYGADFRGLDREGFSVRTGFNVYGVSRDGKLDGRQSIYNINNRYNSSGYDRIGLNQYGLDANGYGYDGYYENVFDVSCSVETRASCQKKGSSTGVEVLAYTQGKTCEQVRCQSKPANTGRCLYGGRYWTYGQEFTFGCQKCTCGTDGVVRCACSPRVRKEIRDMTADEVRAFTSAVTMLYASGNWQQFANIHLGAVPQAHGNPAFFPWHREFLRQLEQALREVSGNCELTIPYWDWTIDTLAPENSPVWAIVGGNGVGASRCVVDGPFAGFSPCIERRWSTAWPLPTFGDIASILASSDYETVTAQIEARHGDVHMFVGGIMTTFSSPYDPLFFLHHAFVDNLWYDWQVTLGNGNQYPSAMLHLPLSPFAVTAADVLDSEGSVCVRYAPPSTQAPCTEPTFAGAGGYYNSTDTTRPGTYSAYGSDGYNRDGFDKDGYDRNGYDRYGYDRKGYDKDGYDVKGVTADGKPDTRGVYGSDGFHTTTGYSRLGYDRRGYDRYGYDANGRDERGCGGGFSGPFYGSDVYSMQQNVYNSIKQGKFTYQRSRNCRPLNTMPAWFHDMHWVNRGAYAQKMLAYEDRIRKQNYTSPVRYDNSYGKGYDYCFDIKPFVPLGPKCPPGILPQSCSVNPCQTAKCPNHPKAVCRTNNCGGCRAEFFVDQKIVQCFDAPPCEGEQVQCLVNPCSVATCPANPKAVCVPNYCEGCNTRWLDAATGTEVDCELDPCVCPEVYDPVCGEDGETYGNKCKARCADVAILYAGECQNGCICTKELMPVCGTDGKTYGNACLARCAKVSVDYAGECQTEPVTCDDVNFYRASADRRAELCERTQSLCSTSLTIPPSENKCMWDSIAAKCRCKPSENTCSSSAAKCLECCNVDIRTCLSEGNVAPSDCKDAWLKCRTACEPLLTQPAETGGKVDVSFNITLDGVEASDFDPEAFTDGILEGLGKPGIVPQQVILNNITIDAPLEGRRRRREDSPSVTISTTVRVDKGDAVGVSDALKNAAQDGDFADALANKAVFSGLKAATLPGDPVSQSADGEGSGGAPAISPSVYVITTPLFTLPAGATMTAEQIDALAAAFASTFGVDVKSVVIFIDNGRVFARRNTTEAPSSSGLSADQGKDMPIEYMLDGVVQTGIATTGMSTTESSTNSSKGSSDSSLGIMVGAAVGGAVLVVLVVAAVVVKLRNNNRTSPRKESKDGGFKRIGTLNLGSNHEEEYSTDTIHADGMSFNNPVYTSNVQSAK